MAPRRARAAPPLAAAALLLAVAAVVPPAAAVLLFDADAAGRGGARIPWNTIYKTPPGQGLSRFVTGATGPLNFTLMPWPAGDFRYGGTVGTVLGKLTAFDRATGEFTYEQDPEKRFMSGWNTDRFFFTVSDGTTTLPVGPGQMYSAGINLEDVSTKLRLVAVRDYEVLKTLTTFEAASDKGLLAGLPDADKKYTVMQYPLSLTASSTPTAKLELNRDGSFKYTLPVPLPPPDGDEPPKVLAQLLVMQPGVSDTVDQLIVRFRHVDNITEATMPYVGIDGFAANGTANASAAAKLLAGARRALLGEPKAAAGRLYDARIIEGLLRSVRGDSVTPVKGVSLLFSTSAGPTCTARLSTKAAASGGAAAAGSFACKACDRCMKRLKAAPGSSIKVQAYANKAKINGRTYKAGPLTNPPVQFRL